jgi:hypothetical protein
MGLDTVEIVMCWEESLGVSVSDGDAVTLVTPAKAVDHLARLTGASDEDIGVCLGQRAFHRIRQCLSENLSVSRSSVTPDLRLRDLLPNRGAHRSWCRFATDLGFGDLVATLGLPLFGAGSTSIKDIVTQLVARRSSRLVQPSERWTRQQLRAVVRTSVDYVAGVKEFSDDDEFVGDMGID